MSESDSFIREVSEEVRQERMLKLWKRFAPLIIGGFGLIIAVAAGINWYQAQERAAAMERGGALLSGDIDDLGAAEAAAADVDGPAAPIAALRVATAAAASGDTRRAIEAFRAVAATPGLDPAYADLAALKAARLEAEAGDPAVAAQDLAALVPPDAPYRLLALELRAALRVNLGDTEGAVEDLETILADPLTAPAMRSRVEELGAALGRGAASGRGE